MFFFFNDTATTEIYTLSLHDALPISRGLADVVLDERGDEPLVAPVRIQDVAGAHEHRRDAVAEHHVDGDQAVEQDRKSTRLNSSHANISYAVFCLKKKKKKSSYVLLC